MSTAIEQIQQLIQEIGPVMQEIDAIVQTEDPSWAIQFSDESIIIIEAAEEPARMVISSEIGAASDQSQQSVYETLLCYNLMWRDTGGMKIGLAGPKGSLIISTDIALDGLMLSDLKEALDKFLSASRLWKTYVNQSESSVPPPLPGTPDAGFNLHA